ncbi:MAG: helix-turn-helix domain-containing protein [Acidobacteria bacterium]|nr:helix-turn-helix domain-containing protein [Acidobacteriota bacterium]
MKIEPVYQRIGERLRQLRELAGLTQEEVAHLMRVSRTSICNVEKGRQRMLAHQIFDYAVIYDVEPALIFTEQITEQSVWVESALTRHLDQAERAFSAEIARLKKAIAKNGK